MSVEFENGEPVLPPEPIEWRTRPLWAGARLWCGATTFFMVAFLFAYVYLRSLDSNNSWKIGSVHPSAGLGLTVVGCILLSGALYRIAYMRPQDTVSFGVVAIFAVIAAVVFQFIEWTMLGFGGASGGYASVFIGWTATYTLGAVASLYWLETSVASWWRAHRNHAEVDPDEEAVMRAGVEASSFYWAYYAIWGLVMYIFLYIL